MTLRRTPGGELLQHSSATVVLVVVADQKPGRRERATCATPQPGEGVNSIMGLPGWFAETPYLQWFPPPENRPHGTLGYLSPAEFEATTEKEDLRQVA